jgi:hypothetical protein
MSILRVWTDVGGDKPVSLIARITEEHADGTYTIQYLSPTDDRDHGRVIYRYEDETYQIDDESVTEYMNTDDETTLGFVLVGPGDLVRESADSDDEDYVPSDEDEDDEDEEEGCEDEEDDEDLEDDEYIEDDDE